ncbi:MAG TPA: DNA double-strand break repair nuclease NurA [Chloroflexi bacterium]|nr:DNA double-strand break repair nuclease NurA [Chloroflexota bacterium]
MLEFHKLTGQVESMSEYLAGQEQSLEDKLELALTLLNDYADEKALPRIRERVQEAIERDAGYRGASPLDEPLGGTYGPAPLPERATLVATDGSQIYPRRHREPSYYLINIGTMVIHHGSGEAPEVFSEPYLFYEQEYLYLQDEGLTPNAVIDARRTIYEMTALTEHTWLCRDRARPLVALLDNPLLFFMSIEVPERRQLRDIYFSSMNNLLEIGAGLAGYIDKPDSTFIVRLLHLLSLPEDAITRGALATSGSLEGLRDIQVFSTLLKPGWRTALLVQMSPQNKQFRQQGSEMHEIAFFYLNVAAQGERARLARIEIPMWVVRDRTLVAEMQALIYHQCQQLTKRYPYILTRADELAVVKGDEARQLDRMIRVAMVQHGMHAEESEKQATKKIARGRKTRFEVG